MARALQPTTPHARSEVWERPAVVRAIDTERHRLGMRLRTLRRSRRLTRESAAEAIGVHWTSLQRIETGQSNVTLATLVACALAYGVPLRDLFDAADPAARAGRSAPKAARKAGSSSSRRAR